MDDNVLIMIAVEIASEIHAAQRRNDDAQTPYINHCIAVASLVAQAGGTTKGIAAAVLHDSVEDSLEDQKSSIMRRIGALDTEVLGYVLECTDDITTVLERIAVEEGSARADHVRTNRKLLLREFKIQQARDIVNKSTQAKYVKLSDCVHNTKSLVLSPPKWSRESILGYADSKKAVFEPVRDFSHFLTGEFDRAYMEVQTRYGG